MSPAAVATLRNLSLLLASALLAPASFASSAEEPLPVHLRDRGTGVATSRFGTYVRPGEWLVEAAFEHVKNKDREYDSEELGFGMATDSFQGDYRANRGLLFVAYGLGEDLAVELEASAIDASQRKAPDDPSSMPAELSQSGLGRVQARLDWRWLTERGRRPELFSYGEVVFPHDEGKRLIGTTDWIFNGGVGATRGFRWGTLTARLGFQYDTASATAIDFGEYAVEYLKRVSAQISVFLGYVVLEGDEASLVTELHWSPSRSVTVRLGNRLGVESSALSATSNSTDYQPGIGVVVRFGEP